MALHYLDNVTDHQEDGPALQGLAAATPAPASCKLGEIPGAAGRRELTKIPPD